LTDESTLLSDPVFQLNTMLWSLEELPDVGDIHPVLRSAGYYIHAIGKRVVAPPDPRARQALARLTARDLTPSRPDLWLRHQTDPVDPLIELKARGFSPRSSKAVQALKLLAAAADLEASVGGGGQQPGHVVYVTVGGDAPDMADTLSQLRSTLANSDVAASPSASIGLMWLEEGVALMSPLPAELPAPAQAVLSDPAVVLERSSPDDEVTPLYFIPWLPGIEESQDPGLHSDGLRELTARLLIQAIAAVGQARVPTIVTVSGAELLSGATFGIFPRWRDADRQQFAQAAAKIVERAVRATGVGHLDNDRVEIDLPTEEKQVEVLDRLERADPADPARNLEGVLQEQPTLFDRVPAQGDPHDPSSHSEAGPDDGAL
jgi:hypothetical protein